MPRLLLATNNPGKVREFRRLLQAAPNELVTPADLGIDLEVEETGSTYAENATLKARAYAGAGGCLALADDSGLEVDALNGEPGIFSARYGGEGLDDRDRCRLLLQKLDGISPGCRTARFRATVAIARPDDEECPVFEGVFEGRIAAAPRGDDGFGYDPVFELDDGRTAAELLPEEKDRLSHRGKAVRAAATWLRSRQ